MQFFTILLAVLELILLICQLAFLDAEYIRIHIPEIVIKALFEAGSESCHVP